MIISIDSNSGFCFGVTSAIRTAEEQLKQGDLYCLGDIVHNGQEVARLEMLGLSTIDYDDLRTLPPHSRVLLRAHGEPPSTYWIAQQRGIEIIDATCPFVRKIHDIVEKRSREGYHIVIIGSPIHPEVQGIKGWVDGTCSIIENAEDIEKLRPYRERPIWIVSQTTFNHNKFKELVEIMEKMGYHVVVTNTICSATKERQTEALELARTSDTMIVIGGKHSSNTQKLYDICLSQCKNTYHIQTLDDLVTVNIQSDSCVGITAGASTPNTIIQEVFAHVRGTEL